METKLARTGRSLANEPPETWANTLLFELAEALGYEVDYPTQTVEADPDEVLDRATDMIWRYRDLQD